MTARTVSNAPTRNCRLLQKKTIEFNKISPIEAIAKKGATNLRTTGSVNLSVLGSNDRSHEKAASVNISMTKAAASGLGIRRIRPIRLLGSCLCLFSQRILSLDYHSSKSIRRFHGHIGQRLSIQFDLG